jgi:hypothetical protein
VWSAAGPRVEEGQYGVDAAVLGVRAWEVEFAEDGADVCLVIAPLTAGIRIPRRGRPPNTCTKIDRHYETLRRQMQALLNDLGITTKATAASTTNCRSRPATL